ncbi:glucan phosphoethanolaminetransferase (alkaline phosphatase superfamily) [Scopulibacillus daqui]|uniref:Glucan phosphoethanolaminetransferase (Alkaline phosphatase superfamily) n=1 Tax=Scopulibacillus daqui TaxID=1469162 RepID=A0ABS2Q0W2_9BACL|nr:DUF1189 family protein [Scopulibacillus daqui]MBM7645771.1 glucan phosphoethanolaminetransferase (alkaline phosphatase superfamily) [Scopulibacillus daqui]
MSIFKQLMTNLTHPKKASMFRFQRIGKTISYTFLLALAATVFLAPADIKQLFSQNPALSFIFIPIFFIFYYAIASFAFFIGVSMLAFMGLLLKELLHKRLNYQQTWSLSANAITWPALVFSIGQIFYTLPEIMIFPFILFSLIMLFVMIYAVPGSKSAPNKSSGRFL